ncbi:MAG: DotU family type IV/VI secretion system protein [Planctomycetes bacterium]|nr:DotU family type IV/VI secretion system protein [Planctomycetota bacterium]
MSRPGDRVTSLTDLCAGAFAFVVELQSGAADASGEPLRYEATAKRARDLLAALDTKGREHGFTKDAVDQAKYALTALIDEVVLASKSSLREEWLRRPLAAELFSEFNAGEEFFHRLEQLGRGGRLDPQTLGVLEVYGTCLSLGFRGMHIDQSGVERLREILFSLSRRINEGRENTPLAPHWQPEESVARSVGRLPPMVLIAAGLAAIALLYGLFELLMYWDAVQLGSKLKDA